MATRNIGAAALAILHAFLLHGGPGPAVATANALGAIVETVGCGGVINQSLQSVLSNYKSWNTSQDALLGYTGNLACSVCRHIYERIDSFQFKPSAFKFYLQLPRISI